MSAFHQIGQVKTVGIDLHQLLRGVNPAVADAALHSAFLANPGDGSINACSIELSDRRILVDSGAGELFGTGDPVRVPAALRGAEAFGGKRPRDPIGSR